jgi:hypothetical protein
MGTLCNRRDGERARGEPGGPPRRPMCRPVRLPRQGVCHACESGLLDGDPEYHIDPLEPPAEGRVLLCCARPASEVTLDL